MWFFLATEIMLFGGLFLSYTVYRITWPAVFAAASNHLLIVPGVVNTTVLLTSSLFMALAVYAADAGSKRLLRTSLVAVLLLGLVFLTIKGFEYRHEFDEGLLPILTLPFRYDGPNPRVARLFFSEYLLMTGLHAVHLILGVVIVGVMSFKVWRFDRPEEITERLRITGLYWHLVDVFWLFLFPMLYLIERHG